MKNIVSAISLASLLFGITSSARSDVVTEWNEKGVVAGYTARISPGVSARNIAMLHIAIFEALNSIEPRYLPYRKRFSAEPTTSREAAAAAAAHYILVRVYPDQAKELNKALETELAAVTDGQAKTDGFGSGNNRPRQYFLNGARTVPTPPTPIVRLPHPASTSLRSFR
jgi:hypothetical protein